MNPVASTLSRHQPAGAGFAEGELTQAHRLGLRPMPRQGYAEALADAERRFGADHVLYEFPDEHSQLTVGDLIELSADFASALRNAGLARGDSLAVWSPPSPLWPVAMLGAARIGARICGLNTRLRAGELAQVLGALQPRLVLAATGFFDIDSAGLLREALGPENAELLVTAPLGTRLGNLTAGERDLDVPAPHHDEVSLIQFTSGSTSTPKGVLITQSGSLAAAHYGAECLGIGPDDRMYSPLPFFHIGGTISTCLAAITSGCTMVIPRRFDAAAALQEIERGCTAFQGHGALWRMLLDAYRTAPRPLPSLRRGWASGDHGSLQEIQDTLGVSELVNMFGSSEAGTIACTVRTDPEPVRLGTLGHPTPGTRVRVLDPETDVPVAPGEIGELWLSGPMVMRGYLGSPPLGPEGLRTGDLVRFDGDVLRYAGRIDDRLKPGGENVSVAEVESFLRDDPLIEEAIVVGIPDRRLGEIPAAVVQLTREGADDQRAAITRIATRCRRELAGFKAPRTVQAVDTIPMLDSGKVDRRRVRQELIDRLDRSATETPG
ncbi:acyl--CoA ligase [Leucobacter sp. CSA1]|uniref:Acyl--CoA ligase n=2 Tax=Leucobacter chromiisoli TaxID=2796471 RepID=A0A934Q6V3_9MICO|nr:acyl--CoA ligase [Leucobacter chromiisoli]